MFVVQWLETFENLQPVVKALRDAGRSVELLVTAERDIPDQSSAGEYNFEPVVPTWDWLAERGFAPEPLIRPEDELEYLLDTRPSAVFFPAPYDGQRHESLAHAGLKLPIHYVGYGFNLCPLGGFGPQFELPFYRECSAIYVEDNFSAEQFVRAGVDESLIIKSGHPSFDYWDTERPRADVPTVLWCPWWSTRWSPLAAAGYSTFISSYQNVLAEAARRPHTRFIFRPHPCSGMNS